jgi:hypothetical protein
MKRQFAKVNTNANRTLWYIESLIEKKFGLPYHKKKFGSCLYSQFVFTIAALAGKKDREIHKQQILDSHSEEGDNPLSLIQSFSTDHRVKYVGYQNIDKALEDCKKGQPTVMVISTNNPGWCCDLDGYSYQSFDRRSEPGETYIFKDKPIRQYTAKDMRDGVSFHALLIVGYDVANDFVIFRDVRTAYSYRGYTMIKRSLLRENNKAAEYFSFALYE